jgi:hypothetical protein
MNRKRRVLRTSASSEEQKDTVSNSSNGFDLKQFAEDLTGFFRDRASTMGVARGNAKPDDHKVDLAVLSALDGGSKNAKQVHQAVSVAAAGSWLPGESQIHQSLGRLAEAGKISSATKKDRVAYTITEAGKNWLADATLAAEAEPTAEAKSARTATNWMTCDPSFLKSASKLTPVLIDIAQTATRQQQQRAAELLEETRHQLHVILTEK